MAFQLEEEYNGNLPVIKVIGVGGGGGNAVNRMINSNVQSVEFIAINTDDHVLQSSRADQKIHIGAKLTHGKGAGSQPAIGEKAALENTDEITEALKDTDMVFITAGMGGGTGTGAAPVVASIARDMGILTVAIVTKPFGFEGKHRMQQAEAGIEELRKYVDSLVIVPNDRLKCVSEERITFKNAFEIADDVLRQGVQSISDLILIPGLVNLDFADVTAVMENAGLAHMGVGTATGKDKAVEAAKRAISSPLLETTIDGAKGLVVNITAPSDIGLDEIEMASSMITEQADEDANIIWGAVLDDSLEDEIRVTVIATGFGDEGGAVKKPVSRTVAAVSKPKAAFSAKEAPVSNRSGRTTVDVSKSDSHVSSTAKKVEKPDDEDTFFEIMKIFGDN